jgi:hypothetical protein
MATGIGSMPFDSPARGVTVSIEHLTEAPFWPQLPQLGLNEQMEIQYSEGMPRAVIDREKQRMFFDTSGDYSEEFAAFYEQYMLAMEEGSDESLEPFGISPEFSRGLYAFEERVQASGQKLPYLKVQTTGPCSFALTIVDENKRSIFYNEEFRDLIMKALALKCRWQIRKFAAHADQVICFVDEPILSAFGSSTYVSVKREEVVEAISEVIDAIHAENALAGVHCCGNTEWSIPIDAGADIVNFDAYEYGETIAMYPNHVNKLFERGGALAWGIVPTSKAVRDATPESLAERLLELIGQLASTGVDRALICKQAMVTPSCGTGSMPVEDAEKVFPVTAAVARRLRETC